MRHQHSKNILVFEIHLDGLFQVGNFFIDVFLGDVSLPQLQFQPILQCQIVGFKCQRQRREFVLEK